MQALPLSFDYTIEGYQVIEVDDKGGQPLCREVHDEQHNCHFLLALPLEVVEVDN